MATPSQGASAGIKGQPFDKWPVGAKLLVLGGLLVMVTVIYFLALHGPKSTQIEDAKSQETSLLAELTAARHRQQEFLALSRELANREAIDRFNKRILPEDAEIPTLQQDLNRVADASGVRLKVFEPIEEQPGEHYTRVPVRLALEGRFHQVAKFFFKVSQQKRVVNLEDVKLDHPVEEGEGVLLQVQVLATTFRRPSGGA